ncbi:hypothetical protein [Dyella sp. EPa41]|uniref:hypothetical protein n=1 Tax=Dyella sp. EPa41 TaxID=1561194 RepID=UPI001F1D1461|nr:hypothetical protein [Dyella sp. EPa41]
MQKQCGVVWIGLNHSTPSNFPRLVAQGVLTPEQAARVDAQMLRVGDPECMVYASFGIRENEADFRRDRDKRLISIALDFRCDLSPVSCPGWHVEVRDGLVSTVRPLTK